MDSSKARALRFPGPESDLETRQGHIDPAQGIRQGVAFNHGLAVTMNFIVVNGPDGWVIYDVESPHDSLRTYLAQYRGYDH
jgi:hypothetical protein